MRSIDILNAVGEVDDEYVTKAKAKKASNKKLWIALGSSLAACLALVLAVPIIFAMRGASAPAAGTAEPHGAAQPPEDYRYPDPETAPVYANAKIFYVADGKICSKTQIIELSAENAFIAWREANNIGDEVEFVKCEIKDNSFDTEKVTGGVAVVEHTVGDYFILNVTISKNIENYYDRIDSELLLDSLKQTMTGYSDIEFDEYHLILV